MRRALTEIGRAKWCGLVFLTMAPATCAGAYLSGGGDGLVSRLMILVSGVVAPLSVFVLEWIFEVDREYPRQVEVEERPDD